MVERRNQQSDQNRFYHDENGTNYGLRIPQIAHTAEISTLAYDFMSPFGSRDFVKRIR